MAPDEPSGARPAGPVVLRIKLRYDDVEAMIARFAVNVGKTGLFLPTKSIQPVGTEIKFELRIATDQPVLIGLGRVKASRAPDPDDPGTAYGMAVELMRVTRESRELILKMLERRKQLGLLDIGLPMPADIDAARRAEVMESGVREAASGAVPQMVTPVLESAPVLTAPRRTTGPIALQKVTTIEPLAPETPRKKRVPVADLIASASGPIVAPAPIDGLDDNIDVGAALARARMLAAGTDLDGELEALRDAAAAPLVEIGIEAASAELARQLGGSAVSKSARWARPPQIAEPVAPEPAATEIDGRDDLDVKAPTEIGPENRSHQFPPTEIEPGNGSHQFPPTNIDRRRGGDVEAKAPTDIDRQGGREVDAKALTDIDRQGGREVDARDESVSNNEHVVAAKTEPEPKRRRFGAKFDRQVEVKAERAVEAKAERQVEAKAERQVEAKAEPQVEAKAERQVEAKAERVAEAKSEQASVDAVPVPVAPEPVAEVLAPTREQIEAPAAETRDGIDRADIDHADIDRADARRADARRADIDRGDIDRADATAPISTAPISTAPTRARPSNSLRPMRPPRPSVPHRCMRLPRKTTSPRCSPIASRRSPTPIRCR